ncbi:MAG: nucleotidyltransferase family protein [Defluviitaleaceae bacterium]|nr:nucleotidyltransferase family protein [Defluviitaleaceae bacterium]
MIGFNTDLETQIKQLEKILSLSPIYDILRKASGLGLENYYVGAGCIAQTVWNYHMGLELAHGISDIDLVYYDNSALTGSAEELMAEKARSAIGLCGFEIDVNNQARVHLWYKDHFGYDIHPYKSVEDAINSWPTTATAVGVRLENGELKVYAPFGLNDLFGMVVRANKKQITEEIYANKADKWKAKWPKLTIIPW